MSRAGSPSYNQLSRNDKEVKYAGRLPSRL